ncbi:transketolase family protein [Candidatus Woesearchaeota archaeon]|nr:transketolase family protein [Candidatus Woesearchaeota archaeon]
MNSTRQGLGDALVALGDLNKNLVVLTADLATSTNVSAFAKTHPERFYNVGIAEQNMLGIAAGMAFSGKVPFATTFGVFATGRAWDQLRTTICYAKANVKVAATHCGVTVGEDGATHQSLSDLAVTRSIPHLTILSPCDYNQTKKAVFAAAEIKGPVYLRLGRTKTPLVTTSETPFKIGGAQVLCEGGDAAIIATGEMVYEALMAAQRLALRRIKATVINIHTIKPIDEDAIKKAALTGLIITAEDHHIKGGLGSAVAEVLADWPGKKKPLQVMVGVEDVFGTSGPAEELMKSFHITSEDIYNAVLKEKRG